MKRYRITNRVTKETYEVEANAAQEAAQRLGWMIRDCYVRIIEDYSQPDRKDKKEVKYA